MKFICVKSRTDRVYIIGFNYKHKMTSIMVATLVNHVLKPGRLTWFHNLEVFLLPYFLKQLKVLIVCVDPPSVKEQKMFTWKTFLLKEGKNHDLS